MSRWVPGDRLTHRDNPGMGAGRVVSVAGRVVEVEFPGPGTRLRLAADSPALLPLVLSAGLKVRRLSTGLEGVVVSRLDGGQVLLDDDSRAPEADLWPLALEGGLLERLAAGDVDPVEDFALRLDAAHLARLREAEGLGTFLGGRIRLFPHQLHVAERASVTDPVRWLLADEVGLGKTVEACLVLNRLLRTGRVDRCLVVAPDTLTVQWLGELWRKYHQVFVLLDDERIADVERDFGKGFNPFDAHRRVVVSLQMLAAQPRLTKQAVQAGIDLLVVDEAHRLRRPKGHAGDPGYRAIAPIAALGRHVLLLTATPLEDDAHGFFRLLQLLRPEEFPEERAFEDRLASAEPLPACTSSTRREDIGGLPPRRGVPVVLSTADPGWTLREALESELRAAPATDALQRKRKSERLRRALSSGVALNAVLPADAEDLRQRAAECDARDPRLAWLAQSARGWKEAGEKTLVFVAHRETLELVRESLSQRAQIATTAFHEDLQTARRDIEVAQFRQAGGASMLVSTECGGEGRNFEFCTRIVLFDLPWNPVAVEQRIGRLDRIGRSRDVEIVYFVPPAGIGADVVRAYERVGIFREPLAGLEPELASLEAALERTALGAADAAPREVERAVSHAVSARQRVREAAHRELHRDPYEPSRAAGILARVPEGLDALNQDVVVTACERLGLTVEKQPGRRRWSIELGNDALVDNLPGVPGGSSFVGTFDRDEAVADEAIDFYAAGHPLVEGVLAHLDDAPRGRVAAVRVTLGSHRGLGLMALYREPTGFRAIALDENGGERPEWLAALTRRPLRTRRVPPEDVASDAWRETIQRLGALLPPSPHPTAVVGLIVGP